MKDLTYYLVPEKFVVDPDLNGPMESFRNYWWEYIPGQGLVFAVTGRDQAVTPQCNSNENATRILAGRFEKDLPGVQVLFVPRAFVPITREGRYWLPKPWVKSSITAGKLDG